jgi:hypothetical protein
MQNVAKALLSGAVAAVTLTAMHEFARRRIPNAPRLDVLGMRALSRAMNAVGAESPTKLRESAMLGDIIANTAYYSLAASAGAERALPLGAALGAAAGVGVLALPGPMGLGYEETNRTPATQAMAAGLYFAAGLVAGGVCRLLLSDKADECAEAEVWF